MIGAKRKKDLDGKTTFTVSADNVAVNLGKDNAVVNDNEMKERKSFSEDLGNEVSVSLLFLLSFLSVSRDEIQEHFRYFRPYSTVI